MYGKARPYAENAVCPVNAAENKANSARGNDAAGAEKFFRAGCAFYGRLPRVIL